LSAALVTETQDEALMARVQRDDSGAFGELYDRFSPRAYGVARAVTRDGTHAEDIVQEAFLSVWRSRARYRPQYGTVGAWVMGIVRNRAIDSLRRQGRHDQRRAGEHDLEQRLAVPGESLEDVAGERDEAARLRATLARLPAAQREVITLAYFGELSTSEIASELELPLGTVKGRMRLGLDKLRVAT
jgi:RNA polymerase sigma-70 factor (ECF subfamily)